VLLERETGLEPATACLEGRNSTTELLPLSRDARIRTADLLLPKQARYQLRYTPLHTLNYTTYGEIVKCFEAKIVSQALDRSEAA
jgi:hypothetical protein